MDTWAAGVAGVLYDVVKNVAPICRERVRRPRNIAAGTLVSQIYVPKTTIRVRWSFSSIHSDNVFLRVFYRDTSSWLDTASGRGRVEKKICKTNSYSEAEVMH